MNRHIRLLGAGIMVLFVALFAQLNYVQIVHAKALDTNPLNGRAVVQEYTAPRGSIISADGVTLATSVPTNDSLKYLREYPQGPLFAEVTGYYSFDYGSDGAERYYDKVLTGKASPFKLPTSISGLRRLLTNNNHTENITLTVLDSLQKAAQAGLAGRLGSVVALDPKTGAVLAMYSNPTYNPNQLASHNLQAVQAAYKAITSVPGGPLDAPAYRQTWFPGSSFKVVTASAIYDHDPSLATQTFPHLAALTLPQSNKQLHNFAGEVCGGQLLALFTVSCDTGFGQIGLDLGANNLYDEAHAFGFDQVPPIDLPFAVKSNFPPVSAFQGALPFLAYSAIGQENVQASPLEMALVVSAIANGGTIMTPHILEQVTNSQAQVVSTYKPTPWLHATTPQTAAQVTKLMLSVVDSPDGTGVAARIPGVEVAGKTGTAQTGTHHTDDWFVAFAPANNPQIAVSVVLPDQGYSTEYQGGTLAAPIAKSMIETYLSTVHPTAGAGTPPVG
ncbi:MAG TPA: penicillin-binding protein 2 [Acidimicrobiales bacterium]|nr:penicillin-binding protein 2 [Acidimicrobiales bacterium]